MTVALPLLAGALLGFRLRRWWALAFAPAAGVLVLGITILTRGDVLDTPAVFVSIVAAAGIALGVLGGRRRAAPAD